MRDEAYPHPEIHLGPTPFLEALSSVMYPIGVQAAGDANLIAIMGAGDVSDEDATGMLLHELEHWAQFMFFTDVEARHIIRERGNPSRHQDIITERINPYKVWLMPTCYKEEFLRASGNYYNAYEKERWEAYWKKVKL